jgi:hypothetical protein
MESSYKDYLPGCRIFGAWACGMSVTLKTFSECFTLPAAPQSDVRLSAKFSAELLNPYPPTFFACALTFAHRFFAAFAIAALPAADRTGSSNVLATTC